MVLNYLDIEIYILYIQYKKGKPKKTDEDLLQLTAQAMCLEEMFSTKIENGAIFYGETRRREQVYFSSELREEVENIFRRCMNITRKIIHLKQKRQEHANLVR